STTCSSDRLASIASISARGTITSLILSSLKLSILVSITFSEGLMDCSGSSCASISCSSVARTLLSVCCPIPRRRFNVCSTVFDCFCAVGPSDESDRLVLDTLSVIFCRESPVMAARLFHTDWQYVGAAVSRFQDFPSLPPHFRSNDQTRQDVKRREQADAQRDRQPVFPAPRPPAGASPAPSRYRQEAAARRSGSLAQALQFPADFPERRGRWSARLCPGSRGSARGWRYHL